MFIFREILGKDEKLMGQLEKASESVSQNSVEQTAYFRALGEKNGLNLDKYRAQVQQELAAKVPIKGDEIAVYLLKLHK